MNKRCSESIHGVDQRADCDIIHMNKRIKHEGHFFFFFFINSAYLCSSSMKVPNYRSANVVHHNSRSYSDDFPAFDV